MKALYLTLAGITLFLVILGSFISFATTPDEATVYHLKKEPAKWRIAVIEDHFFFSKDDEIKLKEHVLRFFERARTPTYTTINHRFDCLCIVFFFSAIGYIRERTRPLREVAGPGPQGLDTSTPTQSAGSHS